MITQIRDNEIMQSFYNMIPYFKYIVGEDVGFTMSNTQNFLLVKNTDKLKINFSAGDAIPKGSAADICLQKKELIDVIIPEKVFGFPVRTIGIPVFEDGQIAGTMVISFSAERFLQITRLSELLFSVFYGGHIHNSLKSFGKITKVVKAAGKCNITGFEIGCY